ncbi:hypothetical protein L1987_03456 [Smallanthus sonchifolius]|uniref:Uncharacterized protein n=1 Tax=Smallanthus sonchifolius TaxID=185202 RepID=A0ACB9KAM2_9ASTR|nr:hypothetical protein L1987_03456 [Smallanthus sonchifolius]
MKHSTQGGGVSRAITGAFLWEKKIIKASRRRPNGLRFRYNDGKKGNVASRSTHVSTYVRYGAKSFDEARRTSQGKIVRMKNDDWHRLHLDVTHAPLQVVTRPPFRVLKQDKFTTQPKPRIRVQHLNEQLTIWINGLSVDHGHAQGARIDIINDTS